MQRLIVLSPRLVTRGYFDRAAELVGERLEGYSSGDRDNSILHSLLAFGYKKNNHDKLYRKHLALAALSDIEGAIKENMAIRELASVLLPTEMLSEQTAT